MFTKPKFKIKSVLPWNCRLVLIHNGLTFFSQEQNIMLFHFKMMLFDVLFPHSYRTCNHIKTKYKNIYIVFFLYPYTPMCVSTVSSVLSRVLLTNITGILLRLDSNPRPCNSRAVSHQLDYRGCPAARGSSNPMFWQRVPQRYTCNRC